MYPSPLAFDIPIKPKSYFFLAFLSDYNELYYASGLYIPFFIKSNSKTQMS